MNELHVTTDNDGKEVLAWSCPCKEKKDDTIYLIKWAPDAQGIEYGLCHESCLEVVED